MSTTRLDIEVEANKLIAEVGLPTDFTVSLNAGDDWSFIVKLHALVEAAVTHALVVHIGKEDAREIFANLELNNSKIGKVAFAKLYLSLESEDRRYMRSLSELRNEAVHDVRNVSLDLNLYFEHLTLERKRAFMKAFGYTEPEHGDNPQELDKLIARDGKNVRTILLRSAFFLLAVLKLQSDAERASQETTKSRLEIADLVRSNKFLQATRETRTPEQQ